jgi:hypothetical protein
LTGNTVGHATRLLSDGRYLQIDANLRHYFDRYEAILAARDESPSDDPAQDVYYEYIAAARAELLRVWERLVELDARRQGPLRSGVVER